MKKSSLYLIIGIVLILVVCVVDAIISDTFLDLSSPNSFGVEHFIYLAVGALLLIVGIVFIVLSRKIAKKEK